MGEHYKKGGEIKIDITSRSFHHGPVEAASGLLKTDSGGAMYVLSRLTMTTPGGD